MEIGASGQTWAGVWFTGRNGPRGWDWADCNNKFPLPCVHPYSLLGKPNGSCFEIGRGIDRVHTGPQSRLYLRVNDDDFLVHVQVYRNFP